MAEHLYAASAASAAPGGAAGAGGPSEGQAPTDGSKGGKEDVIDVEFEEKK